MSEAVFGFLGVLIGSIIPWIREAVSEKQTRTQHASYLAVRVICVLDEYVQKCFDVVNDDGTCEGRPAGRTENGEEYYSPQVAVPTSPAYPDDVDWKSLDNELMYRLLALPNGARDTDRYIHASAEHAFAPDYEEVFEARQRGYAVLGLEALKLIGELQKKYRLPPKNNDEMNPSWNPKEFFEKEIARIKGIEEKRQSVHNARWLRLKDNKKEAAE